MLADVYWSEELNQVFVPIAVLRESCLIFLGHIETRSLCCVVSCVSYVCVCRIKL